MVRRTKSRYHTYLYLSPIKTVVFALIAFSFHGEPLNDYFSMFIEAWHPHEIFVKRVSMIQSTKNKNSQRITDSCIHSFIEYLFHTNGVNKVNQYVRQTVNRPNRINKTNQCE